MRLSLTVVTPEKAVVAKLPCDEVTLPSADGEIGILPGHTPLIALLGTGVVRYREGSSHTSFALHGGIVEVANDQVRVLAAKAFTKDVIDRGTAERAKADGESKRAVARGEEDVATFNDEVLFADAQLKVLSE